jgi:hypothetical protein
MEARIWACVEALLAAVGPSIFDLVQEQVDVG